jgi:hypothetical protein
VALSTVVVARATAVAEAPAVASAQTAKMTELQKLHYPKNRWIGLVIRQKL